MNFLQRQALKKLESQNKKQEKRIKKIICDNYDKDHKFSRDDVIELSMLILKGSATGITNKIKKERK